MRQQPAHIPNQRRRDTMSTAATRSSYPLPAVWRRGIVALATVSPGQPAGRGR